MGVKIIISTNNIDRIKDLDFCGMTPDLLINTSFAGNFLKRRVSTLYCRWRVNMRKPYNLLLPKMKPNFKFQTKRKLNNANANYRNRRLHT